MIILRRACRIFECKRLQGMSSFLKFTHFCRKRLSLNMTR